MVKRLAVTGARRDGKMKAADCCSSGSNGPGGGSSGREEEGRPGRGRWESPPSQACSDADKIVRPRPRPHVRPANSPSSVLHYRQDRRSTAHTSAHLSSSSAVSQHDGRPSRTRVSLARSASTNVNQACLSAAAPAPTSRPAARVSFIFGSPSFSLSWRLNTCTCLAFPFFDREQNRKRRPRPPVIGHSSEVPVRQGGPST